ncbi:MAG: hypothetical protein HRT89_02455 [Lentisphaeria bacterium]|nr:hypothetical protein [Lentisphaeria bacterium]NQZ66910.1 hypothetical protein [Lentisphaeria bacterium]
MNNLEQNGVGLSIAAMVSGIFSLCFSLASVFTFVFTFLLALCCPFIGAILPGLGTVSALIAAILGYVCLKSTQREETVAEAKVFAIIAIVFGSIGLVVSGTILIINIFWSAAITTGTALNNACIFLLL